MLTIREGEALIRTARVSITSYLLGMDSPESNTISPSLRIPSGVFVTLLDRSNRGELRGCIGLPYPSNPLIDQIAIAAVEAATEDPRFEPVTIDEFNAQIVVEATVLTPIEAIWVKNPLDLRENIVVGRDGLIVEGMGHHGLLLPQVAVDEGFDSEEFLSQCCLKASLPPDSWLTGSVTISRFQGQIFAESEPNGKVFERNLKDKT